MRKLTIIICITLVILFLANLFIGSVDIPLNKTLDILLGNNIGKKSWEFIILNSRLPQSITALLCGGALAVSGLMLQTAFNNPLAGPSILGINTGASLGAAIVILFFGGSISTGFFSLSSFASVLFGAFIGAMVIMGLLLMFSYFVKNNIMILIIGIMIGYVSSSIISLLNFFSTAEGVHSYMMWGMGNFGGVSTTQLPYFCISILIGLVIAISLIKPLNAMLLGNRYAENLGINIKRTRNLLLFSVGILTAVTTSFCGPISFLGLAVPHITRLFLGTSNHKPLVPLTMLIGSCFALVCNLLCTLPGDKGIIPLNAITPIIGAPVIIYVIINQKKIQYFN